MAPLRSRNEAVSADRSEPGPRASLDLRSLGHITDDLTVSARSHHFARGLAVDLVDRRARLEERRVPVFGFVVWIADITRNLELHAGQDRTEIALQNGRRCFASGYVLGGPKLDEVHPIDLDVAAALG